MVHVAADSELDTDCLKFDAVVVVVVDDAGVVVVVVVVVLAAAAFHLNIDLEAVAVADAVVVRID